MISISEALSFDILAKDRASAVFAKVADKVEDLSDELDELGRKKVEPKVDVDTKRAEEKIERFAKNLRKKVDTAVKNLPDIEIGADSSDADREIAQVKKDLKDLRDKEIGVDIDAAQAEARLRELTARLQRLNAESVDIKVKADTLAAVKALSSVKLDAIKLDVDTKGAERQVGAFASDIRRRLDAAVKTLPELEITADSSDADRDIARLRVELQTLQNAEIGVDIDATAADARIREIRDELDRLAGSSPDIRVQTDAVAAIAALKVVDEQVDELDDRTATVRVRTDRSISDSTIQIAQLGRALAGIALPAGILAAAPPILALGQAAVTASGSILLMPAALGAAGLAAATVKTAFSGFGDAVSSDASKSAEAMAKLSPKAREAATAIRGLAPAWDALKQSVQDEMFASLGASISDLGGKYMPILSDAMTRVAGSFNFAGQQVAGFLQQTQTVSTVSDMFSDLENTVENLVSRTMKPLTSAFVDLGSVGAKVLADVTSGAGAAAERFAAFIAQARGTGQLEAWMRGGLNAIRQLGQIAVNVGSSLASMMRAAGVASGDLLGSLVGLTGRMREFLASAQGQQQMVTIFESINRVVTALGPGLAAMGRALAQVATNGSTAAALEAIATALSRMIEAAAPVVAAFSGITASAIRPLAAALGGLAPIIGPVIAALVSLKVAAAGVKFVGMITGLSTLASAVSGIRGTIATTRGALTDTATAAGRAGTAVQGSAGKFRTMAAAATGLSAAAVGIAGPLGAGAIALYAIGTAANSGKIGLDEMNAAIAAGGPALEKMRAQVQAQTVVNKSGWEAFDTFADSVDNWVNSNIFGVATMGDYNAAMAEQRQQIESAAAAAGVSVGVYEQMNGALKRSTEAARQVSDNLQRIGPAMSGIKNGVAPTKEMQAALDATATSARTAAQEAGLNAQALGGVAAGADQAAQSMQASRDAFIATATGAGMTQKAAEDLANKLGLIPSKARTDFETNAATTALEVQQVADKVNELPAGKAVTVNALTATAQAALASLGVSVKQLPDGTFEVVAETEQAKANLQAFINGTRDARAEVQIDGQVQPAQQALSTVLALIASGRETITIDGNPQPAEGVLSHLLGMVQGENATIEIRGNAVPAQQVAAALVSAIKSNSATVDIKGNKLPIEEVLASLSAASGVPITKDITGDVTPLLNANGTAVGVVQQPATKPLVGDPAGILGANASATSAVQQPATKPMLGDPSDVRGKDAEARGLIQAPATKPLLADPSSVLSADAAAAAAIRTPATKPMVGDPAGILGANSTATGAIQTPATKPMLADPSAILGANSTANGAIQTPATKPMLGDPSDAYAKEAALRGAVGQTATKPIAGNNAPGMGANSALTGAVQQTATKPIAGNNAGGMGANAGLVGAVQAPATKPIGANDSGARGVVSSFVGWVAGLVATVRVVANKIGFSGGGIMPMANGGVVASRQPRMIGLARGDAGDPNTFDGHKLKPMPAGRAKVVGPRTYRVIGDRAQGDELYLPLVKSSRWSQTLLEVGAQRMGRELVPEGMQIVPASSPATLAPMANGGMLSAARAILGRMNARGQMSEDWTWKGAPAYVGQYNDALFNEMKRAGYSYANGKRFLEDYIRRASAPQLKQVVQQPPQVRQVSRTAATASAASTGAQVSATTQAASIVAAIGMQTATLSAKLDAIGARLGVQDAQTVNINNTFPVAEMRQLAEQVARTARQQASLGLFGAPK